MQLFVNCCGTRRIKHFETWFYRKIISYLYKTVDRINLMYAKNHNMATLMMCIKCVYI